MLNIVGLYGEYAYFPRKKHGLYGGYAYFPRKKHGQYGGYAYFPRKKHGQYGAGREAWQARRLPGGRPGRLEGGQMQEKAVKREVE